MRGTSATLPYPRSAIPTGQAGVIYVLSEANISARADQVSLQTLAGTLARHSPRIYTIKSASPALTPTSMNDDTTVFWLNDLIQHHALHFDYTRVLCCFSFNPLLRTHDVVGSNYEVISSSSFPHSPHITWLCWRTQVPCRRAWGNRALCLQHLRLCGIRSIHPIYQRCSDPVCSIRWCDCSWHPGHGAVPAEIVEVANGCKPLCFKPKCGVRQIESPTQQQRNGGTAKRWQQEQLHERVCSFRSYRNHRA